jgi:hypothetical protein
MKRIELIQDEAYDRVIVFIYNADNVVVGLNFHQGVDDLDTHYMKNDAELFDIFQDICVEIEHIKDIVVVANEAIEKYMAIYNKDVRDGMIDYEVDQAITDLTARLLHVTYAKNMDLEQNEVEMLEMTKKAMKMIYSVIIEKRSKYGE